MEDKEFDVFIASNIPEENTQIITTSELGKQWLETAMRNYDPQNRAYSTYLKDLDYSSLRLEKERLDDLAVNAQNNLLKIQEINSIARAYINKDWIIGKVAEVIETNVNSEFSLNYRDFSKTEQTQLKKCKELIDDFNKAINIKNIIKNAVSTTYNEGNYIIYCRVEEGKTPIVSWLPLGVVEVSDYDVNGEPQLLINMTSLKLKLQKTIKKTRKNKALFFEKMAKEIKENYPPEVYAAYVAKEDYAKLDIRWSGCMRINNQNRKYGLTPIFRALYPALMLEQFDETDRTNSKAKAKKIILQTLRKELLGHDGDNDHFEEQTYAHSNLMDAFKQKTVLVTAPAYVEDLKYVEPSTTNTEIETVMQYVNRSLSTLGVSFLMASDSSGASVATISLSQLMKMINNISEQINAIFNKFYFNLLIENGYDGKFAPEIKVLNSELLEMSMKQDLAKLLYGTFNVSLETSLGILGIDVNDEKAKRKSENDEKLDEIFKPRATSFTYSEKNQPSADSDEKNGKGTAGGRLKDDSNIKTKAKRDYDENYNKNKRV